MKESVDVGCVVALPTFKLASIFHEQVDILHEEINADIIKNLLSLQDDGKLLQNLQHSHPVKKSCKRKYFTDEEFRRFNVVF